MMHPIKAAGKKICNPMRGTLVSICMTHMSLGTAEQRDCPSLASEPYGQLAHPRVEAAGLDDGAAHTAASSV